MVFLFARFFGLLLIGLAAGGSLCVVFIERSLGDSGTFYVAYKQLLIRSLTVPLPLLGALGAVAVLVDCYGLWRIGPSTALWLALAAFLLTAAVGVLTKFGHFPLNAMIAGWDPAAPPPRWNSVQATWSMFHMARTTAAVLASALLIASNLLRTAGSAAVAP